MHGHDISQASGASLKVSNRVALEPPLDSTANGIDDIVNSDVVMQGPLSVQSTIIVIDTNILLEFLGVIQSFVKDVEQQELPVLLIIPGAVIYELDGQKSRDGLSWFARRASTWLLKKVKERRTVKGQTLQETCKASRNWKKQEPGEGFCTNDALILDCCLYFSHVHQGRTFLCSNDNNLGIQAESAGISTILPGRKSFCSQDIALALFGHEAARFGFSGYCPAYRNDSAISVEDPSEPQASDDGMDIDDSPLVSQSHQPSHALDLLHLQTIEYFTQILVDLVAVVAESEVQKFGNSDVGSQHAPSYTRKHILFWTASDCLEYLDSKRSSPRSSPKVEVFLTKPYEGRGARRGQDWSRRDWEVALNTLAVIGEQWGAGQIIRGSVQAVDFHVTRIFSLPMRPTGL